MYEETVDHAPAHSRTHAHTHIHHFDAHKSAKFLKFDFAGAVIVGLLQLDAERKAKEA